MKRLLVLSFFVCAVATFLPGALAVTQINTGQNDRRETSLRGGIARIGAETNATVDAQTNSLSLQRGIVVAASETGGLRRDGVDITPTGSNVKIKSRGTAMVSYLPDEIIKVCCMEGSVTVRLSGVFGEFITLKAGQMLIINPAEDRLPEPVEVNLSRLIETSVLFSGDQFGSLGTENQIGRSSNQQERQMAGNQFSDVTFVLEGGYDATVGTTTTSSPNTPGSTYNPNTENNIAPPEQGIIPRVTQNLPGNENSTITPSPGNSGGGRGGPGGNSVGLPIEDCIEIIDQTINTADPEFGGSPFDVVSDEKGIKVLRSEILASDILLKSNTTSKVSVEDSTLEAGDSEGGFVDIGGFDAVTVSLIDSEIFAGGVSLFTSGGSIAINNSRFTSDSSIFVTTDEESNGSGTGVDGGIKITNSSELKALGDIFVKTGGGPVYIDKSTLMASGGITIDTQNPVADGIVSIKNSQLMADSIRARAFGPNAEFIVQDSVLRASDFIKLYAEGINSKLLFKGDVTLDALSAYLAGRTVEVENGGTVSGADLIKVFTDNAQFNITGKGTIAGNSVIVEGYENRSNF